MGWIDEAVVYQVYVRSFADGNGDGVGDLPGLTARLDHLASLGVDAVWLSPCFQSPQADHGYDVSDYTQVDPLFGTVADLEAFVTGAHARRIRVMLDLVPNHCSVDHAWFREAREAPAGSPPRSRFHFADGQGLDGALPPNNWGSVFGGPAWTRLPDGQWYLHSFDASQPDLNWGCDEVLEMMDEVLRFWFDRGVDGFRVDVAHGLVKREGLPDWTGAPGSSNEYMWNQPGVHDIYRRWRKIADEYGACFVGEVWVASVADLTAYASPDELGQAFDFHLLVQPWHAPSIRAAIEHGLRPGTAWALANHDVHRPATRYGQVQLIQEPDPADMLASARRLGRVNLPLGRRRAVAASMLMLALPGAAYLYQGDELALPEVLDLPAEARQDPIWLRSGGTELGRDGCRVPMPWTAQPDTFGFTNAPTAWLPQPKAFGELSVEVQQHEPWSVLGVVRRATHARKALFTGDELAWLEADPDVVAFRRGKSICVLNTSGRELALPGDWGPVRVSSAPIDGRILPTDACAWLSVADGDGVSPSPTPATAGTTEES